MENKNRIVVKTDPETGRKVGGMEVDDVEKKTSKKNKKQKKFKLYKVIVSVAVVGGITLLVTGINKHNIKKYYVRKNNIYKYSNEIENKFDNYVKNDSVLSELINQREYSEYVKYRDMLEAKKKIDAITLDNTTVYEIDYSELTPEYIDYLIKLNYDHYPYHDPEYYSSCNMLKSVVIAIEKYGEEYGNELVEKITARILAAKVVDANNLDPSKVDNIKLDLKKNDNLSVEFDYINENKIEKYESKKFKDQKSNLASEIGENLNDNNILESIYSTQVLAVDKNYEIGMKKR